LLTSDSPRTQLSEIQNEKNLVEIKNGVFGWEQQINTDLGKPKGPGKILFQFEQKNLFLLLISTPSG